MDWWKFKYSVIRKFEHVVFDTPARPNQDDLEALVGDLLIVPTTPDILSIDARLETVDMLNKLKCDRYRILQKNTNNRTQISKII